MRHLEPPFTRQRTEEFLHEAALCDSPLIWAVDDHQGRFVGYVIYHPYDQQAYELGWVLCREAWHKGYAHELTQGMIAYSKGRTEELVIECAPQQTASKRIALGNGFVYQGNQDGCEVYRRKL